MNMNSSRMAVSMMTVAIVLALSISSSPAETRLFSAWQPHKSTPEELLRSAAYEGNMEGVKRLLAQGVPVDSPDKEGWTPLMWAQAGQQKEVIQLLVARGANMNARDRVGCTAVHQAAMAGRTIALKALLKHGAEVETVRQNGYSPLMDAALYGRIVAVELLLAHGADPNAISTTGDTAVSLAEKGRHRHVALLLVSNGADPHAQSRKLQVALARLDAQRGPSRVQLAGLLRNPEILDDLCEQCLSQQEDLHMNLTSGQSSGPSPRIAAWCRRYGQRKAEDAKEFHRARGGKAGRALFATNGTTHLLQEAIDSWEQLQAKYPDAHRLVREASRKGMTLDQLASKEPLLRKAMSIWMSLQNEHPELLAQLLNLAGISR